MEFMETAIEAGYKDINHVLFIRSYLEYGSMIGTKEGRHPTFGSYDPSFVTPFLMAQMRYIMELDENLHGPYLQMHNLCEDKWANEIKLICHIHTHSVELGIVKPSLMTRGESTRQFQYRVLSTPLWLQSTRH